MLTSDAKIEWEKGSTGTYILKKEPITEQEKREKSKREEKYIKELEEYSSIWRYASKNTKR